MPGAGHVLVFNNGQRRPGGDYSSVDELVLPLDENGLYTRENGKAWGPAEPVWSYSAPKKSDFFSSFISGAHRLPNGNTMICSGANGTIFEVTPDKEIVWKYVNPAKGGFGRAGRPAAAQPGPQSASCKTRSSLTPDQRKDVDAFQKEVDATLEKTLDDEQKKKLKQSSAGPGGFAPPGQILATSIQIQLKPTPEQKKALSDLQKSADDKLDEAADRRSEEAAQANEGRLRPGRASGRTRADLRAARREDRPGGPPPGMFNGPPGGASLFRAYKYAADYPGPRRA